MLGNLTGGAFVDFSIIWPNSSDWILQHVATVGIIHHEFYNTRPAT